MVPLHVVIGGTELSEGVDVTTTEVAVGAAGVQAGVDVAAVAAGVPRRLREGGGRGSRRRSSRCTSRPTCPSTVESAHLAAKQSPVPVHGRRLAVAGHGDGVCRAVGRARLPRDGASRRGGRGAWRVSRAEAATVVFYVDTLEHLRRGGRIGSASAFLGSALAIKPILGLVDGQIRPLEKVRTSAARAGPARGARGVGGDRCGRRARRRRRAPPRLADAGRGPGRAAARAGGGVVLGRGASSSARSSGPTSGRAPSPWRCRRDRRRERRPRVLLAARRGAAGLGGRLRRRGGQPGDDPGDASSARTCARRARATRGRRTPAGCWGRAGECSSGCSTCSRGWCRCWSPTHFLGTITALCVGLAVVLGHIWSPFLRGQGGKGVATSLGAILAVRAVVRARHGRGLRAARVAAAVGGGGVGVGVPRAARARAGELVRLGAVRARGTRGRGACCSRCSSSTGTAATSSCGSRRGGTPRPQADALARGRPQGRRARSVGRVTAS